MNISPERLKDCDKLVGHILSMKYRPAQVDKAVQFMERYFQLGFNLGKSKAEINNKCL